MTNRDWALGISGLLGVAFGAIAIVLITGERIPSEVFQTAVIVTLGLTILWSINRTD